MRITTFRIPAKVKRTGGTVELILDETKKEKLGEDQVNINSSDIPKKAKELSDENDVQRTLAKGTLLMNQAEADVFIELRYLTD